MRIIGTLFMTCVIACCTLSRSIANTYNESPQASHVPQEVLQKGVNCLATQVWVSNYLAEIGVQSDTTATVRYKTGSIPGTSPERPSSINVIIYSPNQEQALLLFFEKRSDQTIQARDDGYLLGHSKGKWYVEEGNGGVATYEAIANYAAAVSREVPREIKIRPVRAGCQII